MDWASQIVPAIVLLAANLMSGKHGSGRWEVATAVFGWTAGVSALVCLLLCVLTIWSPIAGSARVYLVQIAGFCLLTAVSRDYEKILRPIFPWNR